jgi:hypothetical protein
MHYRTRDSPEENNAESISEQEQETNLKQLASEKKPFKHIQIHSEGTRRAQGI